MAKNKRKTAPVRNMHSYFGKKGRANQGPRVDDGSEQVNLVQSVDLVATASHVLEEQEGLEAPNVQEKARLAYIVLCCSTS